MRYKIFSDIMKENGHGSAYIDDQWARLEAGETGIEIGDSALVAYSEAQKAENANHGPRDREWSCDRRPHMDFC